MKRSIFSLSLLAVLGALATAPAMAASGHSVVDFSHGMQDWYGDQAAQTGAINTSLGNGTPAFHIDDFGHGFYMKSFVNQDFLGNYTAFPALTLSIDLTVAELAVARPGGAALTENFYVELRDYDKPAVTDIYSSVYFKLGTISAAQGSQHLTVTIADTGASALPAGWLGTGDYDASGNDVLPYGQTFGRILGDVDEIVFGTVPPNGLTGATVYYNVAVDNIAIQAAAVPEPAPVAMLGMGLGLLGLVAARRRNARAAAPEGVA
ncbi:MAG: PEP-CTERM sorting domain-containing protein [Duganella sp.]